MNTIEITPNNEKVNPALVTSYEFSSSIISQSTDKIKAQIKGKK